MVLVYVFTHLNVLLWLGRVFYKCQLDSDNFEFFCILADFFHVVVLSVFESYESL